MDKENQTSERIIKTITSRLKKMDYTYEFLDEKQQKYIYRLEESISEIFKAESEIKSIIAKNKITTKTISESSNIARQTIYNIPILNEYINFCADEFNKVSVSANSSAMSEELQELNKVSVK